MKKINFLILTSLTTLLIAPVAFAVLPKTSQKTITNVLISQGLSYEEIKQKAEAITVKIESDDTAVSGVIIGKEGNTYTVLTNAHVINSKVTHKIITVDGKSYEGTLIREGNSLEGNDLAILTFNSPHTYQVATLAINPELQENQRVYSVGFPEENNEFYFTQGSFKLQAPKPFLGGYQIGYDIDVKPGMSGGALLNEKGELIGINGLRKEPILNDAYNYLDGSQPYEQQIENYRQLSFAVPIETLMEVDPDLAVIPNEWKRVLNIADNVDNIAQQITVRIDNKDGVIGSGAIVGKDGDTYYVFTACHVVSDEYCQSGEVKDNYTLVTPDGEKHPLNKKNIILPKGMDAAIIKFKSKKNYKVATIAKYNIPINRMPLVFVSGFPGELKGVRKFTAGSRYQEDRGLIFSYDNVRLNIDVSGYELIYTNLTRPGMSGGPVLDTNGQVIGINTGEEGEKGSSEDYQLGYAFGVPSTRLLAFAEQKKVNLNHFQVEEQPPEKISDRDWKTVKKHPAFVVETPPKDSNEITWLNYGNQLFRVEREEEAITAYKKALEINPNFAEAYYGLGFIYERLMYQKRKNTDNKDAGKEEALKAIEAFDKVFELGASWHLTGLALYRKSRVLEELEQYEEALIAIDQSIEYISNESKARFYFQTYHQRGDTLEKLGRYSEAKEAYDRSIEIYPSGLTYLFRGSLLWTKLNKPEEAIKDFNQAIESGNIYAYGIRGNLYLILNNNEAALADYNQSLQFQPEDAMLYVVRGIVYEQMNNYPQALADFNRAIESDPSPEMLANLYLMRSNVYSQIGNIPQALGDLTKRIELEPKNDVYYFDRHLSYFLNGQYKLSLEDVRQAIKLNPEEAKYYQNSGLVRNSLGDTQGALEDYNKAIKLNPNYAEAYYSRGLLYAGIFSDFSQAMADWTKAIELNPKFGAAYVTRGIFRSYLSDFQGALEDYTQAILLSNDPDPNMVFLWVGRPVEDYERRLYGQTVYPNMKGMEGNDKNSRTADILRNRGDLRLKLKDTEGALQDYNEAIKLAPEQADAYVARGDYYTQIQQPEKAKVDYDKAITIYSESIKNQARKNLLPIHYSKRAAVYRKIKNYQAAIADYSKVIDIGGADLFLSYESRGAIYQQIKDYEAAIKDFSKAIELHPESIRIYNIRGIVYLKMKNYDAAITDFSKSIQLGKKSQGSDKIFVFSAYVLRGSLYQKLNDYQRAIEDFSSAIKLQPNSPQSITAYVGRGLSYTQVKNYPAAIEDWSTVIKLSEKVADPKTLTMAYIQRGSLYKKLNDYQGAIEDFSSLIKLQPKNYQGYVNRCAVYIDLKDYNQAINDCNQAIKIAPNNPTVYSVRSYFYVRLNNYSDALKDANKIIQIAPDSPRGYWTRGVMYFAKNNQTQALYNYELALSKDEKFAPAISSIGFLKYEQGDKQEAVELWQKAINLKDDLADTRLALAVGLYHQGQPEKALSLAKEAINMDRRLEDINYLKDNLWSEKLIKDTDTLFKTSEMKTFLTQ